MQRPKAGVGRVAAAALVLGAAGCVQILGLHERPDAPDAGNGAGGQGGTMTSDAGSGTDAQEAGFGLLAPGHCGSLRHPSASCAACVDEMCCTEATACAGDAACQEAADCFAGCADATCRARCATFYTRPDSLFALSACRVANCGAQCGSTCGELSSSIPGCQACREAACCTEGAACGKNPNCGRRDLCQVNCAESTSCPTDCDTQIPEGVADYSAWQHCIDACASACPSGQDWACLDQGTPWPRPKTTASIRFSITIVDFLAEKPFAGADVKACDKFDFTCANPFVVTTTDEKGIVTVTVPGGSAGFDGYLDISGGMNASGSPIFPALWYPRPSVIANGWRGKFTFVSREEFTLLGAATGTTIDPLLGHFATNASDCSFTPAAGVAFTADPVVDQTKGFYFVEGVPVTNVTMTDPSAGGGFVNLPAGRLVTITATSGAAGGRSMGHASFVIRAGTFTTTSFPPAP